MAARGRSGRGGGVRLDPATSRICCFRFVPLLYPPRNIATRPSPSLRCVMRFVSLCVFALLLSASAAFAQFDSATVLGTVRDTSNAVVPAAKVTLTAVETGISIVRTSSDAANYEFSAVKPGKYV